MIFKKILTIFSKKEVLKQNESSPEMRNVVNSMFLSTPLYDKLKIKCHPDKFIDEYQKNVAEKLFQELQEQRFNYEKLLEIEIKIKELIELKTN